MHRVLARWYLLFVSKMYEACLAVFCISWHLGVTWLGADLLLGKICHTFIKICADVAGAGRATRFDVQWTLSASMNTVKMVTVRSGLQI